MGLRFRELTRIDPFALDQTASVLFEPGPPAPIVELLRDQLEQLGGTAGFLLEHAPAGWLQNWADAFLLSLDNELT
jgi:hypothetical protein